MLSRLWIEAGRIGRAALVGGACAALAAAAGLGWWALHRDQDVLFANLAAADAAALTAELDRLKLPYTLGPHGDAILVDRESVHATRLKLMGRDIPLHGAVGFELFNNADFGMTEFAQKVNYQRALQGEITRTVLSLAEVASARVHIAFAEEGLFRRERGGAKASVTLAMKPGRALAPEQVLGIQRLVAAAVSGVEARDVTIVDEHGIALTPAARPSGGAPDAGERLTLKRQVEDLLRDKVASVLARSLGPGRALASVDVTLDMDQVRVTKEDVTHPPSAAGEAAAGVIVRERESARDNGAAGPLRDGAGALATQSQRETEYQVGRRVEQVVSMPGAIQRLQVLAVVDAALAPDQGRQLETMVATAAGVRRERGDVIVVQSLAGWTLPASAAGRVEPVARPAAPPAAPGRDDAAAAAPAATWAAAALEYPKAPAALAGLTAAAALLAIGVLLRQRARRRAPPSLTAEQRSLALQRVRGWLNDGAPVRPPQERRPT